MYNSEFDHADVAKLVDAPDLGSGAERCESSSLSVRTNIQKRLEILSVFFHLIPSNAIRDLCKKALPPTADTQTQVFVYFRP